MLSDAGPNQGPLLREEITDEYEAAEDCNSVASSSHAIAADTSGSDPGPE
jgi:hypothetical protein